ncbi:MAG: hypothetical protein HBSIN02_20940 [Bacteroidia bacterium]|nr:MAG: hypothetical protein HBSIN02_20940 [Bacteroidia bacterium]
MREIQRRRGRAERLFTARLSAVILCVTLSGPLEISMLHNIAVAVIDIEERGAGRDVQFEHLFF